MLVTEDPGRASSSPAAQATDPQRDDGAALVRPVLGRGQVIAKVDQAADGGPTDVDGRASRQLGRMGVVGNRRRLGGIRPRRVPDRVQAHTLWVEQAPGEDNNGDGSPTSRTSAKGASCC